MPTLLQINDNNLLVQQGDSWARSQGYAWLKDGDVYFDIQDNNNAVQNCRLEPQQINSRYWQQCAQTALPTNDAGMRHAADLIWRHLVALQKQYELSDVLLIVPSHYQASNLRLLLGVAKAANMLVQGLVNKAVHNLYSKVEQSGQYLHIDVQLHQTVCSEVVADAGRLYLGSVEILHDVGLQPMQDALLRAIQERFISSDRFDPLHYAETEQQLFDQLPKIAEQLKKSGKANLRVRYQGREHACSIDLKQWSAALQPFAKQFINVQPEIKNRYSDFNGFQALAADAINSMEAPSKRLAGPKKSTIVSNDENNNIVYCTELLLPKPAADTAASGQNKISAKQDQIPSTQDPSAFASHAESDQTPMAGKIVVSDASHLMQSGKAVDLARAHVEFNQGQLKLALGQGSNVASLMQEGKLFVMSDRSRQQLQIDDRLGSDMADGVITVIKVLS